MPNRVEQAIVRTTFPELNKINDPYPGATNQTITAANIYAAQLGMRVWLDGNPGGVKYDSTVGTLYGGCFQYVQCKTAMSATPAVGKIAVWSDLEKYIVTSDITAANVGKMAGVWLAAVTAAYYGWIQTKGKATVLFTTLTASPVDGDLVVIDVSTSRGTNVLDATSVTGLILKSAIGVALGLPTASTTNTVLLRALPDVV
jgi:hypothetical protein